MPQDPHADISSLEKSFGDVLKTEFGTGVPQIATVVAVVLGSLQLKDYFDAGAWTVVAVLCFLLVFLYRHQLPSRLSLTTLVVLAFLTVFGLLGVFGIRESLAKDQTALAWLKDHKSLATAYFSFITTLSVALLITSYRKQETMHGTYPRPIENAVKEQLFSLDFYKEKVEFTVEVKDLEDEWVNVITEMKYAVINRTDTQKTWELRYNFDQKTGKLLKVLWDKEDLDVEDDRLRSGTGLFVQRVMRPGQKSNAYVKLRERVRLSDAGIYTSYHPATDLKVVVINSIPKVKSYFDVLHLSQPQTEVGENSKSIHLESGLLPYQGVIMRWRAS